MTNSNVQVNFSMGGPVSIRGIASLDNEPGAHIMGPGIVLGLGRFLVVRTQRAQIRQDGSFEIAGLVPGRYTLAVDGNLLRFIAPPPQLPESQPVYIKRVECGGVDYTGKILSIEPAAPLGDCNITLAKNPGVVTGIVQAGDKTAADTIVVLIPESQELRQDPAYIFTGQTDAGGKFQISKVIPGDYFAFAVPLDKDNGYFALHFAEQNQASATRVTVRQNESATVTPKRFEPK